MCETGTSAWRTTLFAGRSLCEEFAAKDTAGSDGCRARHFYRDMIAQSLAWLRHEHLRWLRNPPNRGIRYKARMSGDKAAPGRDLRFEMSVNNTLMSKVRVDATAPIIRTKQAARDVNGQHVEMLVMGYTDRIMITVTTEGKLGQLVFSSS